MNTQTTATKLVQSFRQNGLTRKHPSFFGQPLSSQNVRSQALLRGATSQHAMLCAFGTAGLIVADLTFFGLPRGRYLNRPLISTQPNATATQAAQTFLLPRQAEQYEILSNPVLVPRFSVECFSRRSSGE